MPNSNAKFCVCESLITGLKKFFLHQLPFYLHQLLLKNFMAQNQLVYGTLITHLHSIQARSVILPHAVFTDKTG